MDSASEVAWDQPSVVQNLIENQGNNFNSGVEEEEDEGELEEVYLDDEGESEDDLDGEGELEVVYLDDEGESEEDSDGEGELEEVYSGGEGESEEVDSDDEGESEEDSDDGVWM
jgi:hypothetical protein